MFVVSIEDKLIFIIDFYTISRLTNLSGNLHISIEI